MPYPSCYRLILDKDDICVEEIPNQGLTEDLDKEPPDGGRIISGVRNDGPWLGRKYDWARNIFIDADEEPADFPEYRLNVGAEFDEDD